MIRSFGPDMQPVDFASLSVIDPDDSTEALFARHRSSAGLLQLVLIASVATGAVAAACAHVEVSVIAPGILVPVLERQSLRSTIDGIVKHPRVRAGVRVHAGDTLVTLAPGAEEHADAATRVELHRQYARQSDLRALMRTQFSDTASTVRMDDLRMERSRATARQAAVEWEQASVPVQRAERTRDRLIALTRRGFAVPAELESAEFDVTRAREDRVVVLERHRAVWSEELADTEQQIVNLERDFAMRMGDRAARHIVAPVSGTVENLMALTAGSVVRVGDAVALISPDGGLVADVLVPPRDVVFLREGMPARLIVDGYNVQEYGAVKAVVTQVASDYTITDGHAVFRVRVRPLEPGLRRPDGSIVPLGKGLRCQVRFTRGRQRVLALVRHRAAEWFDPTTSASR